MDKQPENCGTCDWHYPPKKKLNGWWEVWCAAWDTHKHIKYHCKRWNEEQSICLIEPPEWCNDRKEYK